MSIDVSEFPASRKVDVSGIGNEVKFTEEVFVFERFPFGVGAAGEANESGFQIVESLGVIEDAHTEDAVRSLGCQRGYGLENGEQVEIEV